MKIPRNYRISEDVDTLLKAESARLTAEAGAKVSEADVIEMAVVQFLSGEASVPVRKVSKKAAQVEALRASDPMGAERSDIEFGNMELPSGGSVAVVGAAVPVSSNNVPVETEAAVARWRAGRKPLLRPKEQK